MMITAPLTPSFGVSRLAARFGAGGEASSSGGALRSPSALPEGWVEYVDRKTGKPYYFNEKKGETTWRHPGQELWQPQEDSDKQSRIPISTSLHLRRMFGLDNAQRTFGCELLVTLSWASDDEQPVDMFGPAAAGFDWEPRWKPRFVIKNVVETLQERRVYIIRQNENAHLPGEKRSIVTLEARLLLRLFCDMDLRRFPFDVQRLEITMEMESIDARDAKFVPFQGSPAADYVAERCAFEDMRITRDRDRALVHRFYVTERNASRRFLALSGLKVQLTFCRLSSPYLITTALVFCSIGSFALTAWASADVADRQSVDLLLLLTAATFSLVGVGRLPRVPQCTLLDYYTRACVVFVGIVLLVHSALPWLTVRGWAGGAGGRLGGAFASDGSLVDRPTGPHGRRGCAPFCVGRRHGA